MELGVTIQVLFQSTHPSGVRLAYPRKRRVVVTISIHAPQWGATSKAFAVLKTSTEISIHAPQWGATRRDDPACRRHAKFNPRTPVGCDQTCAQHGHARHGFQSTHPSGVRPLRIMLRICALLFQSTHPSGVRPHIAMSYGLFHVFQSTHPSGVRRIIVIPQDRFGIFQSTHPSGVRRATSPATPHTPTFQSTHPSGVRRARRQ